ncbi:transcriptional regulator [Natrinema saccharevitans]|uniref:Transcriptional regulator n=1 Tax=Natrinema saccharevitans TaxID=301967 RepID=A0A1S8AYR5_9EURY|nr:transcriptional regulator [Natrinema saccharevitans]OLZ42008.1 transcriptional regulator [Natrinema saccharevitans]
MSNKPGPLGQLANSFASVIPDVDTDAEHDRWKPGIGPFEEENQIEMILEALEGHPLREAIETEVSYLEGSRRCDLFLDHDGRQLPVEAKLLRFRYDNGNIDPNSFARIFTPFPERSSSSLLTDTKKLYESEFGSNGGVLGLYYEKVDEEYEQMTAEAVAEKFCMDVDHWYEFQVETRNIAYFDELQHPVHQQGAVITWEIVE